VNLSTGGHEQFALKLRIAYWPQTYCREVCCELYEWKSGTRSSWSQLFENSFRVTYLKLPSQERCCLDSQGSNEIQICIRSPKLAFPTKSSLLPYLVDGEADASECVPAGVMTREKYRIIVRHSYIQPSFCIFTFYKYFIYPTNNYLTPSYS